MSVNEAVAKIIKALGGNSHTGMCRCPLHNDQTPSLHVSPGNKRAIVMKCHAGCPQEKLVEWAKSRGLWPTTATKRAVESNLEMRRIKFEAELGEYERFRRASAILRAAALENRSPGKYLRSRGIDMVPDSAMLLSADSAARFGLPRFPAMVFPVIKEHKLVGAHVTPLRRDMTTRIKGQKRSFGPIKGGYVQLSEIEPKKALIIGEGTESTLSAMQRTSLPGIATLGTSGMISLIPPDCSEIIIAADNDEPGIRAANALARRLADGGYEVRIAAPEVDGDDWNDALRKGGDKLQFRERLLGGKRIKRERQVRALPVQDFLALEFPKRPHYLQPWLAKGSLAMIHAERGAGKTWLVLSIACAISKGTGLLSWGCDRLGRVLYVDGELPGKVLQSRLALLGPPSKELLILSRDQFHQRQQLMFDLGTMDGRDAFDEIIERHKPDVIILDSLSTLVRSGVENDAESWAPIQDWAMGHRWRGRSIIFVHHEGRGKRPRGTSKKEDVLDTMIGLKRAALHHGEDAKENESTFELEYTKAREFYGQDAAPMVLHLSTASGRMEWTFDHAADDLRAKVAKKFKAGYKGRDIAKEFGITEGRVSQIKREIASNGGV